MQALPEMALPAMAHPLLPRSLRRRLAGRALWAAAGWAGLWPGAASAQAWVSDVHAGVSSGFEGADTGIGPQWQRARSRIVVGLDLGNDERPEQALGARVFVELERTVSLGAELGYVRWFSPELSCFLGGVAVLTPGTLAGGTAAVTYLLPLGERFSVPLWGSLSALPFGEDRGNDGVVIWALLGLGVRGRL